MVVCYLYITYWSYKEYKYIYIFIYRHIHIHAHTYGRRKRAATLNTDEDVEKWGHSLLIR